MSKRKETAWALSLLAAVSALCLAGLKAVDRRIAEKKEHKKQ